ncbi:MAG: HAD-IA family hydrolase [Cyanobacteria bacterium J06626_26]
MVTVACNGKLFTNIQAIFLDKDGTLANVAAYLSQLGHTQAQLMEHQLPNTYDLTLRALGLSHGALSASGLLAVGSRQETIMGIATVAAMVGHPWVQAIELARATLRTADQQYAPKAMYTPLLPGALEFLKRLRQAQLKVIMVSADSQDNLENFVRHHHLNTYFDKLQGVSRQNPSKLSADFLPNACQAIKLAPSQGLVIGDSASDLRMAQSACGFIGYLGGWHPTLSERDILGKDSADHSNQSLAHGFATDFSQISLE